MKYIVVVPDGMADRPMEELEGKTPLEVAEKPNMDLIARRGKCGLLKTMYSGMPLDSGVANLAILGYDPRKYYPGRGPLEAARLNLGMGENDVAMRCNFVTEENQKLKDFTAGHIGNDEVSGLIEFLNGNLCKKGIEFHAGVSYRNILMLKDRYSPDLDCKAPHDIVGKDISKNMVRPKAKEAAETAKLLNEMMLESRELLGGHEINRKRVERGKNPANMVWFWGPGKKPRIPSFESLFGISGGVISAVDIIRGIGTLVGLDSVDVKGATGYFDTNYEGKADAALESLENKDFVFIHLESTDEAGHEGSAEHKIRAIEDIDKRVIGRVMDNINHEYVIGLTPDHATPVSVRNHTDDLVPFAIYDGRKNPDSVEEYSERAARKGSYGTKRGTEFIGLTLRG